MSVFIEVAPDKFIDTHLIKAFKKETKLEVSLNAGAVGSIEKEFFYLILFDGDQIQCSKECFCNFAHYLQKTNSLLELGETKK